MQLSLRLFGRDQVQRSSEFISTTEQKKKSKSHTELFIALQNYSWNCFFPKLNCFLFTLNSRQKYGFSFRGILIFDRFILVWDFPKKKQKKIVTCLMTQ